MKICKFTINDIYDYMTGKGFTTGMFSGLGSLLCFNDYKNNIIPIDNYFTLNYGEYRVVSRKELNSIEECFNVFMDNVISLAVMDGYTLDTLYKSTKFSYNPIENYSMTEKTTTTYNGGDTSTTTISGSETTSNAKNGVESNSNIKTGSITDNLLKTGAEKNVSIQSGSVTGENVLGVENETTTHSVSADDSTTYSPDTQDTNKRDSKTDTSTTTYNNVENTNTLNFEDRGDNKTTTYNDLKDVNTLTFENRVDTQKLEYVDRNNTTTSMFNDRNDVIEHNRSGNIGVMSSQDMIEQERNVASFSFWKMLFEMFADKYLFYIDIEEGCI